MANIAERLKELRKQRGLSQQELAKAIGISKSAIGNYEMGIRNPTYENLEIICDYFNVDMDYLLGKQLNLSKINLHLFGESNTNQGTSDSTNDILEDARATPGMHLMFATLKGCTEDEIKEAIAIIKALKEARDKNKQ